MCDQCGEDIAASVGPRDLLESAGICILCYMKLADDLHGRVAARVVLAYIKDMERFEEYKDSL